ncbi:MAG: type II toxin-antitoxin system PemK/MazF family toxin [Candidatus Hydrogenedentes bacterium]|nr:type II toxin-antitoxin system PemK/MazF family toxin [Candidatus Hydrogenedentota bacterium]
MVVRRGDVWWADLPAPRASEPRFRRPVVILQCDGLNKSGLNTVVVAILTSNLDLVEAMGNVLLERHLTKLPKHSVANISQLFTLDRNYLLQRVTNLPVSAMTKIDVALKLVLDLGP